MGLTDLRKWTNRNLSGAGVTASPRAYLLGIRPDGLIASTNDPDQGEPVITGTGNLMVTQRIDTNAGPYDWHWLPGTAVHHGLLAGQFTYDVTGSQIVGSNNFAGVVFLCNNDGPSNTVGNCYFAGYVVNEGRYHVRKVTGGLLNSSSLLLQGTLSSVPFTHSVRIVWEANVPVLGGVQIDILTGPNKGSLTSHITFLDTTAPHTVATNEGFGGYHGGGSNAADISIDNLDVQQNPLS